jgi:hypothetical protein
LTLDWHPIFNAAPEQAEKLPRVRKDWTANPTLDWHTIFNAAPLLRLEKTGQLTHLPGQTIREQIISCLMMIHCTYIGEGKLVMGCCKQAKINRETLIQQSATHTR